MRNFLLPLAASLLLAVPGCLDERPPAEPDDAGPVTADDAGPVTADDAGPDETEDTGDGEPDAGPAEDVSTDPEPGDPCEDDAECADGLICEEGHCTEAQCVVDGDCGQMVFICRYGRCRDRCLGPGTCIRGGVCVDGACMPPECEGDGDCEGEDRVCREGRCEDLRRCEDDGQCGPDERCQEGRCEPLPRCGGDRGCGPEEICEDGRCRPRPGCEDRQGCDEGEDCVDGRCVPWVCRGDGDCAPGETCSAGECVVPEPQHVAEVLILTRPRTLVPAQQVQLVAVALDLRDDIVATSGFTWESGAADIVGVDEETGLATAGDVAGVAELRAGLAGDDGALVWSDPLPLTVVVAEAPVGLRVRVTDAATGQPLAGATVRAGEAEAATGDDGVAELPGADPEAPVSVFHPAHDYVTLVGVARRDLHVPLPRRSDPALVAGFSGEVDFDRVTSEGGVEVGLAGASISSGFTQLDIAALVGDIFESEVAVGGFSTTIPLPGGVVLSGDLPIVGRTIVKDTYYALADPGFRLVWGFAGRIDVAEIMSLFRGGGGGLDVGMAITTLLPYFERFEHGLRTAPDVVALPRIVDEDDVDGDGDVEELVPDYDGFPVRNIRPDHAQGLRLSVEVPAPPAGRGGGTDAALLFAGVEVEGVGFVPLGVSSAQEAERVPMRMTPPYGGLEAGSYAVLALATRFESSLPEELSARMVRADDMPAVVDLGPSFLPLPVAVDWRPVQRELAGAAVETASLHRAVFDGPDGRWFVWFAAAAEPVVTLPFPPGDVGDLAAGETGRFEAIVLPEGVGLDDLAGEGGAGDLLDVDTLATSFSRIAL